MACPDAESIAELFSEECEPAARAAFADHAAACPSCHAVVEVLFDHTHSVESGSSSADMPATIDRYVVRRKLGAGGMGVVYVAHDPELDREVAIKMLRRGVAAARLRREAKSLARLSHPNVVAVHDVGEHDGQVFVAMALVDGVDLRRWLKAQRTPREIVDVLLAAGRGIVAAHTAGLIHRDLKPDNIFISTSGDVLVGDFGLARDADDDAGAIEGTPAYMPPEQADGRADERSDQYSFCVTAFEALHGKRPFAGATLEEIHASARAGRFAEARPIDARVDRALRRGLRANPAERFDSMADLLRELAPRSRRMWWLAAGGVLVVGAAVATTVVVTRESVADAEAVCSTSGTPAWNPLVRGALEASLAVHGNTPDAIVELGHRLDRYATEWTRARHDACVAQVSGQLTLARVAPRVACLEIRKTSFEVTTAGLIGSDADVFTNWKRVATLAPPASCNSDDALRLTSGSAELMRELAVALNTDSSVALVAVAAKAEKTTDVPGRLEVTLAQAREALDNRKVLEADTALAKARPLAEQLDVPSVRVRAFALSARSLCAQNRMEEAERFLAIAQGGVQRLKEIENAQEIDEVEEARTECLVRQRKFAEVEPLLVQRLATLQRRFGRDGLEASEVHQRLGNVYLPLNRMEDARREWAASRAIEFRFVKSDENAAFTTYIHGAELMAAGDREGSLEYSLRAIAMLRELRHPDLVSALVSVSGDLEFGEQWIEAEAMTSEALALIPADTTDEAIAGQRVAALDVRGMVRLSLGNTDAAVADLQAAYDGATKLHLPDLVTSSQLNLARAWVAKHEYARAVRTFRALLEVYRNQESFSIVRFRHLEFEFAQALWETGDREAARTTARAAESTVARYVAMTTERPLIRHLGPSMSTLLASIERWRDAHR